MTPPKTAPDHQPPESEVVNAFRVCCDGGGAALGHPRVWLSVPLDTGWVECGYCDKRFIHEDYLGDDAGRAA